MAKKKVEKKVVDTVASIRKAQDDSRATIIKTSATAHEKSLKG